MHVEVSPEVTMRMLVMVIGAAALVWSQAALAFDLQGHRGARGLAPENTSPGFAAALSIGVTTLELDTAITKDGVVVISHDSALNPDITRTRDGKWLPQRGPAIHTLTFAELQQYDVGRIKPGTDYANRYREQKSVDGARIPKLADLFALVRKSANEQVRFNIETKVSPLAPADTLDPETFVRVLISVIRQEGMVARVDIQSFDWRTLQAVQRITPELPTVYLSAQQRFLDNIAGDRAVGSPWTAGFQRQAYRSVARMVKAAGGRTWSPYVGDLSREDLREAHDLGLKVIVWTVDEPAHIKKMFDLGVDGIITDRPDLARHAMTERGMALPPATPVSP